MESKKRLTSSKWGWEVCCPLLRVKEMLRYWSNVDWKLVTGTLTKMESGGFQQREIWSPITHSQWQFQQEGMIMTLPKPDLGSGLYLLLYKYRALTDCATGAPYTYYGNQRKRCFCYPSQATASLVKTHRPSNHFTRNNFYSVTDFST